MFQWQWTQKPDGKPQLIFSGVINEDVDFSKLEIPQGTIFSLNLEEVRSINSCGIREWMQWFKQHEQIQWEIERMPKILVDQANMVAGFLSPQMKVLSFFVPYYNEDFDREKMVLYEYGQHFDDHEVRVYRLIQDSGMEFELDVIPERYFRFLNRPWKWV